MYCPSCGSEERQRSQFCRACGTDLRVVRTALETPDAVTASAASARDEIGRAFASRIKEFQTAKDLERVAENVLPTIEEFLESPQERRLRRVRAGVVTSAIGLGATLFFILMGLLTKGELLPIAGVGVTAFLIGLGIVINGLLFTVLDKNVPDRSQDARVQKILDESSAARASSTEELPPAQQQLLRPLSSVTEHTTHQLQTERVVAPNQHLTEE